MPTVTRRLTWPACHLFLYAWPTLGHHDHYGSCLGITGAHPRTADARDRRQFRREPDRVVRLLRLRVHGPVLRIVVLSRRRQDRTTSERRRYLCTRVPDSPH